MAQNIRWWLQCHLENKFHQKLINTIITGDTKDLKKSEYLDFYHRQMVGTKAKRCAERLLNQQLNKLSSFEAQKVMSKIRGKEIYLAYNGWNPMQRSQINSENVGVLVD